MKEYNVKETFFKEVPSMGWGDEERTYVNADLHIMYTLPERGKRRGCNWMTGDARVCVSLLDDDNKDVILNLDSIVIRPESELGKHLASNTIVYEYDEVKANAFVDSLEKFTIIDDRDSSYIYMGGYIFYDLTKKLDAYNTTSSDDISQYISVTIKDIAMRSKESYNMTIHVYKVTGKGKVTYPQIFEPVFFCGDAIEINGSDLEDERFSDDISLRYIGNDVWDGCQFLPKFAVYRNNVPVGTLTANNCSTDSWKSAIHEWMCDNMTDEKCIGWQPTKACKKYWINGDFCLVWVPDQGRYHAPWIFNTNKPEFEFRRIDPADTAEWNIFTTDIE